MTRKIIVQSLTSPIDINRLINVSRVSASNAEVGSSASKSSGSLIKARAIATRCCWPTLRVSARRWAILDLD